MIKTLTFHVFLILVTLSVLSQESQVHNQPAFDCIKVMIILSSGHYNTHITMYQENLTYFHIPGNDGLLANE
jgi:hypothetical protein